MLFDADIGDMINLHRFYRRAPEKFKRAEINAVNSFAFGTRAEILKTIDREMTVRNKRFVASSVRVLKANNSRQHSIVGSIERARFSGWAEQQTGEKRESPRVATIAGRGGSKKRQIVRAARLKRRVPSARKKRRAIGMINVFKQQGYKGLFVFSGRTGFPSGVYRMLRGKPTMMQAFRRGQPARLDWMGISRDRYFRKNSPRKVWAASIRHVMQI